MIAAWKPFAATEAFFRRKKCRMAPAHPTQRKASVQSRRLFLSSNDGMSFQIPLAWNLVKRPIVRSAISRAGDTT